MTDLHILIRDLPPDVNLTLNTLAAMRGKPKWEIIRDALIEYAQKQKSVLNVVKHVKKT